mmetsp:Transcript_2957/g.9232  ORF Transcript_2957/g.9232 Transcript_2957/m.9232 type:complete len:499 (+) Transcript_2957:612-2108(+)
MVGLIVSLLFTVMLRRCGTEQHCAALGRFVRSVLTGNCTLDEGAEFAVNMAQPEEKAGDSLSEASSDARDRQRQFWQSVMTKVKVIIAAWQIASSTAWVLPVKFPSVFEFVQLAFSIDFVQLASVSCITQAGYYTTLVCVTVAPLALIFAGLAFYATVLVIRRKIGLSDDLERNKRRAIYAILLLIYIVLPTCSAHTLRYFRCVKFDRGDERRQLKVLAADLNISCRGRRYDAWLPFAVCMVGIWPVGMPSAMLIVLWRYRHRLNPEIEDALDTAQLKASISSTSTGEARGEYEKEEERHRVALTQLAKIEKRQEDEHLRALEFLYEDYEPRTWAFPIFEMFRRIFLMGALSIFYHGMMAQVAVGLLGSMVSYKVFNHYQPYIEDGDNIVSEVAQMKLVLVYFAALVVYVSDSVEQSESVFSSLRFGILLVVVFVSSTLTAAYLVIVELFGPRTVSIARMRRRSEALYRAVLSRGQAAGRKQPTPVEASETDTAEFAA